MKDRFLTLCKCKEEVEAMPNVQFVKWLGEFNFQLTPVLVRCEVHGTEWETTPLRLCVQKFKCIDCSRRKTNTPNDWERIINHEDNRFRFVEWVDNLKGPSTRVKTVCKCCGIERVATLDNLRNAKTCKNCTELQRVEGLEVEVRNLDDFEFIEWQGDDRTKTTPVLMRCRIHGAEWVTNLFNLTTNGKGCPDCARERNYEGKTISEADNIQRVNEIEGITYLSTVGTYTNTATSRFVISHECGNVWEANVNNIINGSGACCQRCKVAMLKDESTEKATTVGRQGYSANRKGYLYFLVSTNKRFAKIGISNVPESRIPHLAKITPFDFTCEGMFEHENGAIARMIEGNIHRKYAQDNCGFKRFDGHSEWFFLSPELRAEMESIIG